jgi:hypothetical protein
VTTVTIPTLESEDYALMESIVRHFALQLHAEREKVVKLTRMLECERERVALLESATYGCSFL